MRVCAGCGSSYLADPPENLSDYYPDAYHAIMPAPRRRSLRPPRFSRLLPAAIRNVDVELATQLGADGSGQVLDVGCGVGDALDVYSSYGWVTSGVEPGEVAAKSASAKGHHVVTGDFLRVNLPAEAFSLVRLSHSVEHLADPLAGIRKAASLVAAGGTLFVELPNVDGLLARVSGESWWQLDPPRHMVIPHRAVLEEAVRAQGFSDLQVSTYSSGHGVARSLFMRLNRGRYADGSGAWRVGDPITPPGYTVLRRLGDPVAVFSDVLGKGDNLRLVARDRA